MVYEEPLNYIFQKVNFVICELYLNKAIRNKYIYILKGVGKNVGKNATFQVLRRTKLGQHNGAVS